MQDIVAKARAEGGIAQAMTQVLVDCRSAKGSADIGDLVQAGFTAAEILEHRDEAITAAARQWAGLTTKDPSSEAPAGAKEDLSLGGKARKRSLADWIALIRESQDFSRADLYALAAASVEAIRTLYVVTGAVVAMSDRFALDEDRTGFTIGNENRSIGTFTLGQALDLANDTLDGAKDLPEFGPTDETAHGAPADDGDPETLVLDPGEEMQTFLAANEEALVEEFGSLDRAAELARAGRLVIGGGAAPLVRVALTSDLSAEASAQAEALAEEV